MYKKILCLTFVILMVCSCFFMSVSATSDIEEKCKEAYIEYWLEDYASTDEAQYFDGKLTHFEYLGEAGCHVFQASATPGDPVEPSEIIGNYRFTAHMCMGYCNTNPAAMYALKDDELMTLKEAYNKGLVDLDKLYESVGENNRTMSHLSDEELLKIKCQEAYVKQREIPKEEIEATEVIFAVQFKNYAVFGVHPYTVSDVTYLHYIDGYWFLGSSTQGPEKENPTGIWTLDNYGNVEPLIETVMDGFIDLDEIFEELSEACNMFLLGDVDGDKRLTVKDATMIQKYLAKIPYVNEMVYDYPMDYCIMEADKPWDVDLFGDNADVTIKDATYIQKKVAKMIWEDDRQPFKYDEILVLVSTEDEKVYTLEDFPEYEFESIERGEYVTYMYTLTLKNAGKENVIDAVNSLKYREGVDIEYVLPNYLYYIDD